MSNEHKSVLVVYTLPTNSPSTLGQEEACHMVDSGMPGVKCRNVFHFNIDEHELLEYIEEGINEDLLEDLTKEFERCGANYIFAREVHGPSVTFAGCLETFIKEQNKG